MENTEIHYEMTVCDVHNEWNEKLAGLKSRYEDISEPQTDKEAIELATKTIEFFNTSLKP